MLAVEERLLFREVNFAMEKILNNIYYNPQSGASFSGPAAVLRVAREQGHKKVTLKQVKEWLENQETYTLHRPAPRNYPRNRVIVGSKDDQFQADLVDLSSISKYNKGYRYLLTVIDILSKYAFAIPLKTKSGEELKSAFIKIFKTGRIPSKLQSDHGTEFLNRIMQDYLKKKKVHFFVTNSETKASVIERFNRTLKNKMFRYFTHKNTHKYIDILPDLLKSYNNSYHRSIKMKPSQVNKSNERGVWDTLYGKMYKSKKPIVQFHFRVGQQVRISKVKKTFEKGYTPNWSMEIFTISERLPRHPPVYRVKDQQGEVLDGVFYEQELQKIRKEDDVFQIDRIIKKRKVKGKVEYLISWKGYPKKFDSWVPASHVQKL